MAQLEKSSVMSDISKLLVAPSTLLAPKRHKTFHHCLRGLVEISLSEEEQLRRERQLKVRKSSSKRICEGLGSKASFLENGKDLWLKM